MSQTTGKIGSIGAALLLSIAVGAIPTWAHNRTGSHPITQVKGLVTTVGGSSLHIQNSVGSAAFTLNSNTHVLRLVNGSTGDLAPGQTIDAQFASGSTTTITSIRIEPAHQRHPSTVGARPAPTGTRTAEHPTLGSRPPYGSSQTGRNSSKPSGVEGQIVSVSAKAVTVKTEHGQTATYQLANNAAVTKILPGKLSDLATGEMVQVWTNRGGTIASSVTILSS